MQVKTPFHPTELAEIVHHLNYRWGSQALALWQGLRPPFRPESIYADFGKVLDHGTIQRVNRFDDPLVQNRIRHGLIDHYLQRELLPYETELQAWSKRAVAVVGNDRIRFREVIPWCQKASTWSRRRTLQKETSALCKLLKPFALSHWQVLLEKIQGDLGYVDYVKYCRCKKGIAYETWIPVIKRLLNDTDAIYRDVIDDWSRKRFGHPMDRLNRFDAICLLGLAEFDDHYPGNDLSDQLTFLKTWELSLETMPGLNLDIRRNGTKSSQAMTIILQIPEEVYVLMRPEGGWIDLETLWHEMGHGLSAALTSPGLSLVQGNLATTHCLSEAFAFLLQDMALSQPFLERSLGLSARKAETVARHKTIKDLAGVRRYAAKFLAEYDMFRSSRLEDGDPYAEIMARHTGFYHQPESHLFDLVPEFYCMDYLLGWMGAASLTSHLECRLGEAWYFDSEAPKILKSWWVQGNRRNFAEFFSYNRLAAPSPELLLERWRGTI
jgi:hypothetical protein